jgi:SecD/SecF fusion protein
MQGKGFIKLLLVLLILVSLLQSLYIFPTRKVENRAEAAAELAVRDMPDGIEKIQLKREMISGYLDSMSSETVFSIPLLKDFSYDDLKQQQLALGLDLKGGQSVVLQVDMKDLVMELSNGSKDPTFLEALDKAETALRNSQSDFITLFATEFQKIADGKRLSRIFLRNQALREKIDVQSSDGEVVRVLRDMANDVVRLTFNRLKQRIDKLGVTQPNVSLDESRDIILVELPGIDNPERARNFLQASAQLEFWDVYRINDPGVLGAFSQADEFLKNQAGNLNDTPVMDTSYTYTYDSLGNISDSVMQVVEQPVDPLLNRGPLLRNLTLNSTAGGLLAYPLSVMGVADRNQRDNISELLAQPEVASLFPRDAKFLWSYKPTQDPETREFTKEYELYMIKKQPGSDEAPLQGDVVISASQSPDPITGEIQVSLVMNSQGAKKWADMTTKAANDSNREIAIALDNEVVTAPRVNGPITGGQSSIEGNFSVSEATDLSSILEVGKLPAKVRIIQESNVGPSLGQANIRKSTISLVAGLGIVLLFMLAYYGGAGIVSIIALFANLFFIFGALASFGTVLTLPGIAGIVLTIGMAVDANVIIYERVREELRAGKSLLASITDGFKNSYSAIIDANLTTILVAILLAWFGLGPIKGFAVVLIIGVLSSLFTAVLLGRLMIDWRTVSQAKEISFWTGWSRNMFANMTIDWVSKRKIAYVISSIVIIAGLASMVTRGFDLGVDFRGGYSYNIEFVGDTEVDAEIIRESLATSFGDAPVVKAVDVSNTFNIVTSYLIDDVEDDAPDRVMQKLYEGVNALQGGGLNYEEFKATDSAGSTHVTASSKVGPTIADDIKKSSFYAGIFALLAIFLYIFVRFTKWQFSLGAVAALFHDSLVVLGLFSIFWGVLPLSLEIDQAFIAALLTVIGYSINDTVVVFDRIREYLGIYTNKSTDEVLNLAINSTFSRTVITSLTTLFVVAILLVFGGGSIKGFAFALLIGIIVGTYSSIFVATPIVRDLSKELKARKTDQTKKHFSKAVNA